MSNIEIKCKRCNHIILKAINGAKISFLGPGVKMSCGKCGAVFPLENKPQIAKKK